MPDVSEFVKIGFDRIVEYGNGGEAVLIYPLYWNKKLKLTNK